jgi:hypothetical protein
MTRRSMPGFDTVLSHRDGRRAAAAITIGTGTTLNRVRTGMSS